MTTTAPEPATEAPQPKPSRPFEIVSDFKLMGDQPRAVDELVAGLEAGERALTLLGATGSGKTFTMANVIERYQRPTLVLAPNRTLAAQLVSEFREVLPHNEVQYFVSYYDYYQPEAYIPRTDTYIAKDADINEEIDKMRHAATRALFERRDIVIVASVSCIYGLGEPGEYQSFVVRLFKGRHVNRGSLIRQLIDMQYARNDLNLIRGTFRVRGDSLTIYPAYEDLAIRVDFFGDEVEQIVTLDPLTGEILREADETAIYPAKHFVTSKDRLAAAIESIETELAEQIPGLRAEGKLLEAQRLEERTRYDLETMRAAGYCSGIENYSRHLAGRPPGSTPWTLLDYFPDDWLVFIDESHISVPQVRGMFLGDRSRKETLVEFGFRLPSALDNRPLNFEEFEDHINQVVYVSATPGPYERANAARTVEQVIRPTGIVDPEVEVRPTKGQIDDLLAEIRDRVDRKERTLLTTLTKKMSEDLNDYLQEMGVKSMYLHSEIDTLERIDILRDLRIGVYDVVVGINLLREGLDLPEVSLVCILDADKEGYLRSGGSLIQTIGRAARHPRGRVIMYADKITDSMRHALDETDRRREKQRAYNEEHGITPQGIEKTIRDINDQMRSQVAEEEAPYTATSELPRDELTRLVKEIERQMKDAAKNLEFERAALLRDQVVELRRELIGADATQGLRSLAAETKRPEPRKIRGGRSRSGPGSRR
ncbi:MAG: excinuclease ABC subunit UvrB [Chloroflexi bacterium]|nr:excinuclease ABC subunit UvrB [Chloroflexota bacterium]MDA1146653.1 excinuclease ABC subunit UvrB [Chloroflexota bacterium]PKB56598.1 MAG: excinuclease ABC subunit B [SAR202 cluster bacterium Casp-Chloro-G1]